MRSKPKSKNTQPQGKNQPLNINISFNINPKNILHNELPPGIKLHEKAQAEQLPHSARGKQTKHRKAENELGEYATSDITVKRVGNE